jgi:hypothetical protein
VLCQLLKRSGFCELFSLNLQTHIHPATQCSPLIRRLCLRNSNTASSQPQLVPTMTTSAQLRLMSDLRAIKVRSWGSASNGRRRPLP